MKCTNCYHENPTSNKFCAECGTKLEVNHSTIECPNCHNQVPADSRFCPDCGCKVFKVNDVDESAYWLPFIVNDLVGFKDIRNDEVVIVPQFYYAQCFSEGMAIVANKNGNRLSYGYINKDKVMLPCIYDGASNFASDFASVTINGHNYYINKNGVIQGELSYRDSISEGIIHYHDDKNYYDLKSKVIIDVKYDYISDFHDGYARVMNNNKWGIINRKGEEVIHCDYDYVGDFSDGLARVCKLNKYGFVNNEGIEIIACKYDSAWTFKEGLAAVAINNKVGFIDKHEAIIIPPIYENTGNTYLYEFSDGIAFVCLGHWFGAINKEGQIVIPCKYGELSAPFYYGKAFVRLDKCFFMIDKKGTIIQQFAEDENIYAFNGFCNGLSFIAKNGVRGIIDIWGNSSTAYDHR